MINGAKLNRHAAREENRVVDIEVAGAAMFTDEPGATRRAM
jgi:hypothetical protein